MVEKEIDFSNVYIERCDKETENLIAVEEANFLQTPIDYLQKNEQEFIYLESTYFHELGVDALSIEMDDVFRTYDVMLGLAAPKKLEQAIRQFLDATLVGDGVKFDLMFDQNDGVWNVNFTLNLLPEFQENISLEEAFRYIYKVLAGLVAEIKKG